MRNRSVDRSCTNAANTLNVRRISERGLLTDEQFITNPEGTPCKVLCTMKLAPCQGFEAWRL